MRKQLDQLREFNVAFSGYYQSNPTTNIPDDVKRLRIRLMREELAEVEEAIHNGSIINLAKEISDLLYVLIGTVEAFGLSDIFEAAFTEVHRSNMSKLDENGHPVFREDGKVLKSANYFKPDLSNIME